MSRPRKPVAGTIERLQMDLEDYGKTWRYIRDCIAAEHHRRGSATRAIKRAARKFRISEKTAWRHYYAMRKIDAPESRDLIASYEMGNLKHRLNGGLAAVREQAKSVLDAIDLAESVFTQDELKQLGPLDVDFVVRLANDRVTALRKGKSKK